MIGCCTGDERVVGTAAGQILDIDQRIAVGKTAESTGAIGVIQIHRDTGIGRRIADAVMRSRSTDAAIEVIGGGAGDKRIVAAAAGQILNIGQRIALRIAAKGAAAIDLGQIDGDAGGIGGIADAVMRGGSAGAAVEVVGRAIGHERIVKRTAGQILDIDQLVALRIAAEGAGAVGVIQVDRHALVGGGVADAVVQGTGIAVQYIGVAAGDKGVVVQTAEQILDIDEAVAVGEIAAGTGTDGIRQINHHAAAGILIADGIDAKAAIKLVMVVAGDKGIVVGAADHIPDVCQRIAGSVTAAGGAVVQIHRHGLIGQGITDRIETTLTAIEMIGLRATDEQVIVIAADDVADIGVSIALRITAAAAHRHHVDGDG